MHAYGGRFDVPIVFRAGGDDRARLGHQGFHLQHGSRHHRRIVGQRHGGLDLVQPSLIGGRAGGVMRAQELVEGRVYSLLVCWFLNSSILVVVSFAT